MTIGSAHLTCACIAQAPLQKRSSTRSNAFAATAQLPGAAKNPRVWHSDGWLATKNVPSVDPRELVRAARSVR